MANDLCEELRSANEELRRRLREVEEILEAMRSEDTRCFTITGEQLARSILDQTAEPIVVCDEKGIIIRTNQAACRLYGGNPLLKTFDSAFPLIQSQTGKHLCFGLSRKQSDDSERKIPVFPCGQTLRGIEARYQRQDGKEFDLMVGAGPVLNVKGDIVGCVITLTDITERKLAEDKLRESERRLADIIDFLPDATIAIDKEGHVIVWNRTAEEITGVKAGDMLGKGEYQYSVPFYDERRPMLIDFILNKNIASEALYSTFKKENGNLLAEAFTPALRPGGAYLWGKAALLYNVKGEVTGAIESIRDITDRKKAEEELRQSNQKLRALIHASPLAIIMLDVEGNVLLWNPAAERMFGWKADEVLGRHHPIVQPEKEEEFRLINERVIKGEAITDLQLHRLRKDGSNIDISLSTAPLYGADNKVNGIMAVIIDVTERKRADEEIRRLSSDLERRVVERTTQLEAANKELESFSYSVSHDLRAPLRTIDGFSQAILEDLSKDLGPEGQDYLQRIREATHRMAQLIEDMLNLSRVTRAEMRRETVDLSELGQTIAMELVMSQPERRVQFIIQPGMKGRGDPVLLRSVLQNLLGNAWKFTGNQPDAVIEFGSESRPEGTVYSVRDNGAGFNMDYVGKLFTPFQRLHTLREFPGAGIGLATVQRIIHRHGGKVWAKGEENKGATFYFTLEPDVQKL